MTGPEPTASVSVVIVTYDRRAELRRTLTAMTALPDAAELIVVDNGSSDGSADMVRREFPSTRLIALDHNAGAVARNVAVRQLDSAYVAFCDDDTIWQPGALARAAELLTRHPQLGSVTGRCLVEPSLAEDPLVPELRHSPVPAPHWMPGPALLGVMAGLTMFRRSAFDEVGGFCERMWLGGEEELLALDLAVSGWWMCWAEDVVIHHAPSTARDSRRRRQLGIRNTLWTLWLRRPLRSAVRRSWQILRSAPTDRYTAAAVLEAARSAAWVARHRRVVPDRVEYGLRLLEHAQTHSVARRYVG